MTKRHPQKPEPLPAEWLATRKFRESRWERLDRAGEKKLREIQKWATEFMANIFVAQRLGANETDADYMDRVDEMYDTIRNALTRQDLLVGFLINVHDAAINRADEILGSFNDELEDLTGPGAA